jgi:hypothetical protein
MSPLGRGLSLFLGQHPDFGQDEGVLGMAGTMNDLATKDVEELAAETDAPESSKRVRKQPERYNGLQYDNDGAYIDDPLLVNQATEEFFGYQDISADEDEYDEEAASEEEQDDDSTRTREAKKKTMNTRMSSKRVRKQPDRYNGLQYDNDGAYNRGYNKLKHISHWHICFVPGLVLLILAQ